MYIHVYTYVVGITLYMCVCVSAVVAAAQSGPSTPAEFVAELRDYDFTTAEAATEGQHGVIDKLRVSLSTNGLK